MSNGTSSLRGFCPPPFFQQDRFPAEGGSKSSEGGEPGSTFSKGLSLTEYL
jgi:hypothetical protein